ncbi:hypothetical protein L4X63_11140 [Geomonas sp. Red32]|uniref:GSU3529 family protein n=1 Tax=Geomonas sp. Red32 TaxID=2912856 RepID=UPI00202CB2E1|nr:hypothetical protein [Geomonas sp. Red32]MCM0082146.1 hypothetical protein [Geomonas sp. Red32]
MKADLFVELRAVALELSDQGDFPDWLLPDILAIADGREVYAGQTALIAELIAQIKGYDPYAGAGCFGDSVGAGTIETTVRKIRAGRRQSEDNAITCELLECCQFFNDSMKDLPKAAEYIRSKLCRGDFPSCPRYRIFKAHHGQDFPPHLSPMDVDEVAKALRCLEKRKGAKP